MRDRARVVIIGGGVGGTSIAYHLAQLGERDVLLVERAQLTSGSTFHSAGLVGQLRSSVTLTRMMMHGADLYPRLHELTGHDPGWHRVGSLRLASTPERMEELSRQAGWAKTFGLPLELVSTAEALELFAGLFDPTDVLGAVYLPTDGWLNPSDLTMAFAAGARAGGVEIAQGVRVTAIGVDGGRVTSVDTDRGRVECEVVVNAAGMYAWEVGRLAGVHVPLAPFAHQYVITRPRAEVPRSLPTMRDPDRLVYFREEVGGLLMGGYERNPAPWGLFGIPADFNNRLLDFDWDRFLPLTESASTLVPVLADAEVTHVINGPEAFTPDGEFLLGETEVRGFFVAAGFCAHGIAGAAGVGKVTAEWIVAGEPQADLWKMDVRRFGPHHRDRRYVLDRTTEIYATYYDITYPNHERASGRPLRVPPAYTRHLALDADMGEKAGWERVNWYRSNENPAHEHLRPRGWAGRNWSTAIVTEVFATRECAGLFDESSFAKIEVSGPGALAYLRRLCANDVDKPVGSIVYTAALNRRGGIECDFTVTRLEADRFLIVTGTAFGQHDLAWVGANAPSDVWVRDVTSALACFALWGPRAREVLANACDDDLSFGYLQARQLAVAGVPCTALRVTYVGEMGWELYSPTEYGLRLWDALMEAGGPLGLRPAGYRAIDAMRLEKGYRVWGSDITNERDPFSAGLGFAVRMRDRDFNGRDALAALDRERLPQRLCCLVLDDARAVAVGNEPVSAHGSVVGRVTSGGVGYWLGCSIAYAWLPGDVAIPGSRVSVEVFGEVVGAEVRAEPLLDPDGHRIRA